MKNLSIVLMLSCLALLVWNGANAQPKVQPGGVCLPGTMCGREPDPKTEFPDDPKNPKPFTRGDCTNLAKHHVSADGTLCVPDNTCAFLQIPFFSDPDCARIPIKTVVSVDPNDKTGPVGVAAARFIGSEVPLQYNVLFENEATAAAPAQQVLITDQLDPATMDLGTFSLGPIVFGETTVTPPSGLSHYSAGIDLRPGRNIIIRVGADLDNAGLLTWRFISIDPDTLQVTADPLAGFLPPNVTPPAGQGSAQFTVLPKPALATGTVVRNQASVVFDVNAPINTPVWSNTIDNTPPTTHVLALPAQQSATSFPVQWTGTDVGSGVGAFTVYVADNGSPFTVWQDRTAATAATYVGQVGHSYGFYSIGEDLAGNVEGLKSAAEETTSIGTTTACASDVGAGVQVTRSGYGYNFTTGRFIQTVTLKNTSGSVITGPLSVVLDNLSSNATLSNPSGTTACAAPAGSPFINSSGNLNSGASVAVTLQFTDPSRAGITYATRVLAGSSGR